ncbi:MAG: DUF4872 domain-containing protein [Bryobacterales bacterium]|nr:DUF4872 domain-containing protein [Bryobacterales bacterium]
MFPFVAGENFETSNVRNLLLASGVEVSEALCLGIGGGIAAGYQFCPSVPNYGTLLGSGVQMIPRVKMMTTNGAWYRDTFERLGVAVDVRESTGKKGALANLRAGVDAGKLVVAWTTPLGLAQTANWTATCGMYTVLVHGIDGDTVEYSDHVSVRKAGLEEFSAARERVCSLKNRTMTVAVGKKLDWTGAVKAGLRETAGDFVKPKLGTFNLPGLKEGVGLLNGVKNKRAWPVVFPGAKVLLPMRDLYESIELGTGGGLMRPMYAAFLEEAAVLLKADGLREVAVQYRELGKEWTAFAEFILPKPFADIKKAMRKLAAGDQTQREILTALHERPFPWDGGKIGVFLDEASARLGALYDRESAVARDLTEVVGKL